MASSNLLFFLIVFASRCWEITRLQQLAQGAVSSIRFPRLPPLALSCERYFCPHENPPSCLMRNLTLSTHYIGFLSFQRKGIGAVAGWLKMQRRSQRGCFLKHAYSDSWLRQCRKRHRTVRGSGSPVGGKRSNHHYVSTALLADLR